MSELKKSPTWRKLGWVCMATASVLFTVIFIVLEVG